MTIFSRGVDFRGFGIPSVYKGKPAVRLVAYSPPEHARNAKSMVFVKYSGRWWVVQERAILIEDERGVAVGMIAVQCPLRMIVRTAGRIATVKTWF